MPNRILRPWADSEAVNSLSDAGEVFFVRLIQQADDYGRFFGSPALLKAYLFPLKDKRIADFTRWIAECVKAGLIAEYEVSGKRYLQIHNFQQRTRIMKSKFPDPPAEVEQPPSGCQSNDSQMAVNCQSDDGVRRRRETETDMETNVSCPKRSARRITFGYDDDHELHGITEQDLADWRKFYPALDIEQELRSASAWLAGNPRNRKSDILRFLTGWLQRAQNRAPRIEQTAEAGTGSGKWQL